MSYIQKALKELEAVLVAKNADYRVDGEFSNFELAAAGVDIKPEDVMLAQIFIKLTRIQGLRRSGVNPMNEGLIDSYRDLAGYSNILFAHALMREDQATNEGPTASYAVYDANGRKIYG